MLPLYERLGMDRRMLAGVASLAAGVNFLPWTGPTVRASAALRHPRGRAVPPAHPGAGGRPALRLRGRLLARPAGGEVGSGWRVASDRPRPPGASLSEEERALRRPRLFWPNLVLTLVVMGAMVSGDARARRGVHARGRPGAGPQLSRRGPPARPGRRPRPAALLMASILLAAGGVHRYHAGHRHARRDGPGLRPATCPRGTPVTSRSCWGSPRCP